jgi:hypothetical protein
MSALAIRSWLPPLLVGAGVTALLGSLTGIATIAGWLPLPWPGTSERSSLPAGEPNWRAAATPSSSSPSCATCGVVESVRAVPGRRDGTRSKDVEVRVVAGTAAVDERDGASRVSYRITVRMDDGSYRTLSQSAAPTVSPGQPVRIADGAVVTRR